MQTELALVQDNVSNVMIGKMKLQFWRDVVRDLANVRAIFGLGVEES